MAVKDKYSAAELVEFGLPGLPRTERGTRLNAKKEGWVSVKEPCKGGYANLYVFAMLPEDVKEKITMVELHPLDLHPAPTVEKSMVKQEDHHLPTLACLKGWQRKVMDSRLAILKAIDELEPIYGTNKAIATLIKRINEEKLPGSLHHLYKVIPAANARGGTDGKRTLSRTSIYRWRREVKKGIAALAPATVEKLEIPAWAPYFLECYQRPQNPSVPEAMEEMPAILPDNVPMPSYSQVIRFQRKRSRLDQERGRKTGSAFKALKGYRKRDTSELKPLDVGVCDGHSFKAKIAHPVHGQPFKPEVCAVLDAATRVVTGWWAGLAESAVTVGGAVRHSAVVNDDKRYGGIYNTLYTDGGSGNKAKINTDEFAGLFPRIGTIHKTGIPGNAQGRGLIERLNKSLWIRAAKKLVTFVGREMDKLTERNMYLIMDKEVRNKAQADFLLSWPAFLKFCQQEVEAYNRRPHSELPKIIDPHSGRKRHMCPLEMWAWHISQGWEQEDHQLSEQEIEVMFLPRVKRTVKRAQVSLFGNTYFNTVLEDYHGENVQVAYDIHDGEKVQIWDKDDRLICYAIFEKNKTSYFPMSEVEHAREQRAKRRAKIKNMQLDEVELERRGVVEIDAAPVNVIAMPTSNKITIDREKLAAEMADEGAAVEIPRDDRGKYRFWQGLDAALTAGTPLSVKELRFYEAYRNTRSYRAFKAVEEDLTIGNQGLENLQQAAL